MATCCSSSWSRRPRTKSSTRRLTVRPGFRCRCKGRTAWPNAVQETEDPYSFGPLLGELDLHLFNEGRHFELAGAMGANAMTFEGVEGVCFSVWAPNASRVAVVGDFNSWDARRHPMR